MHCSLSVQPVTNVVYLTLRLFSDECIPVNAIACGMAVRHVTRRALQYEKFTRQ